MNLALLDSTCKWHHAVFVFLPLTYLTEYNAFQVFNPLQVFVYKRASDKGVGAGESCRIVCHLGLVVAGKEICMEMAASQRKVTFSWRPSPAQGTGINTLASVAFLSPISCQGSPLAKPNQKPDGCEPIEVIYKARLPGAKEGWRVDLGGQTEIQHMCPPSLPDCKPLEDQHI